MPVEAGIPALVEPMVLPPQGGRLDGMRLPALSCAWLFQRRAPGTLPGRLTDLCDALRCGCVHIR